MTPALLHVPQAFALAAALGLFALAFWLLGKERPFLVIFLIFIVCRVLGSADLMLLGWPQAWLGCVLGALKDLLFMMPFLLLSHYRWARIAGAFFATGLVFLSVVDVVSINETFSRLEHMFFENVDMASILIRADFLLIGLAAIGGGFFVFMLLFRHWRQGRPPLFRHFFITGVCFFSFVFNITPQIPETGDYLTDELNMERNAALLIVADSSVRNLVKESLMPPPTETKPVYEYSPEETGLLESWGVLDKKQANPRKKAAYKRVIYVFVESLSYDFLQCKVLDRGACTMPFYFSLLNDKKNVYLSNYYSSSFTTDEGIYAAFASRPDFAGDDSSGRPVETIFSLAAKQGYKSAYFMGASVYFRSKFKTYLNTMHVDEIYGLEQTMDLPPLEHKFPWGDTDGRIFEKALIWLKENRDSPSITIICTINTHPPFFSEYGAPPGVEDTPVTRAFYSTDQSLKDFVEGLEKSGLLGKETLLIIGADHQITHGGELARDHLPENKFGNRHIPLVMLSKNRKPLAKINKEARASAIDMAPTLGDLLALPEQPSYYGKSLFIPDKRYDLAMTRGGLFFFGTDETGISFDLRFSPSGDEQNALYKWYFNKQQDYLRPE